MKNLKRMEDYIKANLPDLDATSEVSYDYWIRLNDKKIVAIEESDPGTSLSHCKWMLETIIRNQNNPDFNDLKRSRWLGFCQGIMICNGMTTVMAEREFTRPFFKILS